MRRIHRERVLLAGGQRALLMQLAHPLVAAGVADHSAFPARPLERLRNTLDLTLATVFAPPEEAARALARVRATHERVVGTREGRPYAATEPRLLLWVHATLVDTAMLVYQLFVRPLTQEERRRYHDETREWAHAFGVPEELVPRELEAFGAYVRSMLEGPELAATAESRRLAGDVLRPPVPLYLRPALGAARPVTLALLPPRVRELFGLRAGAGTRLSLAVASRASRALLPVLPARARLFPQARRTPVRASRGGLVP